MVCTCGGRMVAGAFLHAETCVRRPTHKDLARVELASTRVDPRVEQATPIPTPTKPRPAPRTASGAQRSLTTHYRRIVGEETQAIRQLEEEHQELRYHPMVVRYLEAVTAMADAHTRRDQAARDLGLLICNEGTEIKP